MDHEQESRVIHVEIHGQRYPIRSALDTQYVAELAAFVDEKMRLAAQGVPRGRHAEDCGPRGAQHRRRVFPCRATRTRIAKPASRTGPIELERMVDLALGLADPHSGATRPANRFGAKDLDARLRLK